MNISNKLFWVCMTIIVAVSIYVYSVQGEPQAPQEPQRYSVRINWLDGTHTTISNSDHVYVKDGFVVIRVLDEPLGIIYLPAFSVFSVLALDQTNVPNKTMTLQ